jgi:hypothetical protein
MLDLMAAGVNFESLDPSALAAELAKATASRAAAQSNRMARLSEDTLPESTIAPGAARGVGMRIPSLRPTSNPNPLVDRPMDSLRHSRRMAAAQAQAAAVTTSGRAAEPNTVMSFRPPSVREHTSFRHVEA